MCWNIAEDIKAQNLNIVLFKYTSSKAQIGIKET